MDNYLQVKRLLNQLHPDLVEEISLEDIPTGREKHFTLGNFAEINKWREIGDCNQYYIYMRTDLPASTDEDKMTVTLLHEYGHFLCRTMVYPNLPGLGQFCLDRMQKRVAYSTVKDRATNIIVIIEELTAWLLAWCALCNLGKLKLSHLKYGFRCWKSYWHRVRK